MFFEGPGSLVVYHAYGLRIRSDIRLPELEPTGDPNASVDVEIRLLDAAAPDNHVEPLGAVTIDEDITMLWWANIGRFIVTEGSDICVATAMGADASLVRLALLGPVFGTLLRQRGWYPFRAAALVAGGVARAVVGSPTSAIESLGDLVLAHDMLAIRFNESDDVPLVRPTYPQLSGLCRDASSLARIRRDAARSDVPVPLESIYLTGGDGAVEPREAFITLFESLLDQQQGLGGMSARVYRLISRLATTVPIRRLREHDATSIIAG